MPVVLTGGCPLSKELVGLWNFSYFCEHNCGGYRHFAVHYAPRSTTRFNRFYGEGLGKGGVLGLSFREFAERIRASGDTRYYLQSAVVWGKAAGSRDRKSAPGGEIDADGTEKLHHGPYGDKMASDLQNKIDWRWLTKVCKACGNKGIESVSLWAGHGGGATPIHYDMSDNFKKWSSAVKSVNPDWTYVFWTDEVGESRVIRVKALHPPQMLCVKSPRRMWSGGEKRRPFHGFATPSRSHASLLQS